MNKYKDFDNYLKEFPSKDGYFAQPLKKAIDKTEVKEYNVIK